MIRRLVFGLLFAGLLVSVASAQVGPLPGMAVLPPPQTGGSGGCSGTPAITSNGSAGATDTSVSLSGVTIPGGSLIVVLVSEVKVFTNTPSIGSLSDGVNTYSLAASQRLNNDSTKGIAGIFYVPNASLSSGTVTYTANGVNALGISVAYVSNIALSSALDSGVTNTSFGSSISPSATSGAASVSGNMLIAAAGFNDGAATQDSGNGWSSPPAAVSALLIGGNQVNAGTSAKTYAPTLAGSSPWADIVVGFKCR